MGVEVRLNSLVTDIQEGVVVIGEERLPAENIIWAAGVRGSKVAETLGVELDRQGRIKTNDDLSIPGYPSVFAVGDLACVIDKKPLNLSRGLLRQPFRWAVMSLS